MKKGSWLHNTVKYRNTKNKNPSKAQNIEKLRLQNLFMELTYLPNLYFFKKKIKPDNKR